MKKPNLIVINSIVSGVEKEAIHLLKMLYEKFGNVKELEMKEFLKNPKIYKGYLLLPLNISDKYFYAILNLIKECEIHILFINTEKQRGDGLECLKHLVKNSRLHILDILSNLDFIENIVIYSENDGNLNFSTLDLQLLK